jgi:hypothetical protein
MPVEQAIVLHIVCDNSACPGNTRDPTDRAGWMFVNREVYGSPTEQFVYCCAECSGTMQAVPIPPPAGPPIELPPPEPERSA